MTTNNKDIPPTTTADIDKATLELQAKIEAGEKAREEKDKAKAEKDALKLEGKKALLQSYIDGGASKDQVDALRKSMGLEDETVHPTTNPATPEPNPANTPRSQAPDEEPVIPTVEYKPTPEELKVVGKRYAYLKEYAKCKEVAKKKASIFDVFDGKKKRERKEEESLTKEYKDAKEAYDKSRIEWGNELFNKKKAELVASGVSGAELDQQMKVYKATEILDKTIIGERLTLAEYKSEGDPVNVSKFRKALDWYIRQPRWAKVAMSTTIFTGISIATAGGATASVFGVALGRFARGMASGALSSGMTKLVDVYNKKGNLKFEASRDHKKSELRNKFGSGEITQEQYEKGISDLEKNDAKRKRNQTLAKLGVGALFGAGLGYASSHLGSIGGGHVDQPENIKTPPVNPVDHTGERLGQENGNWYDEYFKKLNESKVPPATEQPAVDTIDNQSNGIDTAKVKTGDITPEETPDPAEVTPPPTTPDAAAPDQPSNIVEAEVTKGHGAIKTLEEFQEKLRAQYPDPSTAPASIQHILNTKADRLAIEFGMFKPGDDAESAIMKTGSEFRADADGNISFEQGGKTTLLEKGDDADVTEAYKGKMIDGDRSGQVRASSESNSSGTSKFLEENPQKAPAGAVDGNTTPKVEDGNSDFLKNNPQKAPAGVIDGQQTAPGVKPATEPTEGLNKPKVEEVKSNLTASRNENISPTKNVFDNSYGTNTETISPTGGVYNTGEGSSTSPNFASSKEVEGNGFTTERPMTNEALAEKEMIERQSLRVGGNTEGVNTGSVVENQGTAKLSITQDPRHVDSLDQARDTFGRSNIEIEKPESEYVNGIKHENWNKAADHMFREKNVGFDSYESYEKEDELQRLLGSAEQKVEYVESLDKNAEVINMEYFRESPEWPTINKIPAKYFFDFEGAKLNDGSAIPQANLNKMVASGILRENVVVNPGEATTTSYSFTNKEELERLSKTYSEILSDKDIKLGNHEPIGDETLEKYVGRMTKRVYTADDGTMFAPKEKFVPSTTPAQTTSEGYETMRSERTYRSNNYNNGNRTSVISPRSGAAGFQTSSDYRIANSAVDYLMRRILK